MEADASDYPQNPSLNGGDFALLRRQWRIEVAAKRAALVGTLELNVFKTRNATVQLLPTTAKEVLAQAFLTPDKPRTSYGIFPVCSAETNGHCGDGQSRSDIRKPRDYKRDSHQSRYPSHTVSTCMRQRRMICHSSGHPFQSWRTAGSSRTRNSSERFGSWSPPSTKPLRCICSLPSQPATNLPWQFSRT